MRYVSWHWQKLMVVMHMCPKIHSEKIRNTQRPLRIETVFQSERKKKTTKQNATPWSSEAHSYSPVTFSWREWTNRREEWIEMKWKKTIINATFGTKLIIFILNFNVNVPKLATSYFIISIYNLQMSIRTERESEAQRILWVKVKLKWIRCSKRCTVFSPIET